MTQAQFESLKPGDQIVTNCQIGFWPKGLKFTINSKFNEKRQLPKHFNTYAYLCTKEGDKVANCVIRDVDSPLFDFVPDRVCI